MYALLIVEDPDDAAIFSLVLQRAGLAVTTTARELEQAMRQWSECPADIIFLSLSKPSTPAQVRRVRAETPVPLIVAVEENNSRLQGELLKLGADLVISRSFDPRLLIAQVGVLMRRSGIMPPFSLPTLAAPGLELDPATRTVVTLAGKSRQRLTHLEFRLLYILLVNRGQVIPTETIIEHVWGYSGEGDRELVRGLVSRLRGKIEADPRHPQYILTVPGVGYCFKQEPVK